MFQKSNSGFAFASCFGRKKRDMYETGKQSTMNRLQMPVSRQSKTNSRKLSPGFKASKNFLTINSDSLKTTIGASSPCSKNNDFGEKAQHFLSTYHHMDKKSPKGSSKAYTPFKMGKYFHSPTRKPNSSKLV